MEPRELLSLVVVVAIFISLSVVARKKRLKSSWEGVVEKKRKQYDDGGRTYKLIIRTKEGKKKHLVVGKKLFEEFEEGAKIVKLVGEYDPKKP